MPGKLLSTNGIAKKDTVTWKTDALRMLKGDYASEATSYKLNILVTAFSLLFALACIVFFIVRRK